MSLQGDKRREGPNAAGPNEIVACTSCAGDGSPCTHTASNNGCATEVILYFNGLFTSVLLEVRIYLKFFIDYRSKENFFGYLTLKFWVMI
jgi:hypothetical protein